MAAVAVAGGEGGAEAGAPENGGAQVRASIEVTLSTGVFTAENAKKFALEAGGSLRIGRDPGNHVTLDLNGVSSTHAELLYRRTGNSETDPLELCICDHSRNGTAVRPGPHVPGSSWASKTPPAWERLIQGVPRPLAHGWQLLTPAKSRKGVQQVPFHKRMLTVYTKGAVPTAASDVAREEPVRVHTPSAMEVMSAKVAAAAAAAAGMEMTPEELAKAERKKRKKERKDDPNRDRKRARGLHEEAPAAASEHDRRVLQCGAVEEELARRELARQDALQSGINQEVARTARPKGKPRQAQVPDDVSDAEQAIPLRSPSAEAAEEVEEEDQEAQAAQRAVAAAAALRAMKAGKKVIASPSKLGMLAAGGKIVREGRRAEPEEIESEVEVEAPSRKPAPLTAANVATLGGASTKLVDFELRSVSPISVAGVKPKPKKKRITKPAESEEPQRRRKSDGKRDRGEASGKTRLVEGRRNKDSPDRWNPSPPAKTKKRSARSDDDEKPRNRSREKRKQREAEMGRKSRR